MDLAIQIQDQFCEIDYEDVNRKLEMIQTQFESLGLTYEVQYGDTRLDDYKNDTAFHMMPTMVYGIWNPININFNSADLYIKNEKIEIYIKRVFLEYSDENKKQIFSYIEKLTFVI